MTEPVNEEADPKLLHIRQLQKEINNLCDHLQRFVDLHCTEHGCLSFRNKLCHATYGCCIKNIRKDMERAKHT